MKQIFMAKNGVAIFAEDKDGNIIFVKQHRKAADQSLVELPGGGVDDDEDPDHAAEREFEEETGFKAGKISPVCYFYTNPGISTNKVYLYKATDLRSGCMRKQDADTVEIIKLPKHKIDKSKFKDAKTIAALGLLGL